MPKRPAPPARVQPRDAARAAMAMPPRRNSPSPSSWRDATVAMATPATAPPTTQAGQEEAHATGPEPGVPGERHADGKQHRDPPGDEARPDRSSRRSAAEGEDGAKGNEERAED